MSWQQSVYVIPFGEDPDPRVFNDNSEERDFAESRDSGTAQVFLENQPTQKSLQ